jgi:outer membrane lipoprotein LolB
MTGLRPIVLGAALLLGGCALLSKHDPKAELAWEARRELLSQIDRFTLQARVSSGGLLGARGNLHWRQGPDEFDMRVAGPFGVGGVQIQGNGPTVEIRTSKELFRTDEPEAFLHDKLGWTFPVRHLRWWAVGLPSPDSESELRLDRAGRIIALAQDDWTLEYDEYQRVGALDLPKRFELTNDEVRIKVVVDAWTGLPARWE